VSDDVRRARQWCDLLGWDYRKIGADPFPRGETIVVTGGREGRYLVERARVGQAPVALGAADLPTLAIATLVRHAGPVDVGPCPECEGHRNQVKWGAASDWEPLDGDPAGDFEEEPWACRPCPACVVDGKPTGRRIVSAPEAVLLAAPVERRTAGNGSETWHMEQFERDRARWEAEGRRVRETQSPGDGRFEWECTWTEPGHEGARETLRALAEGWREHLPVLADRWESDGGFTEHCVAIHRDWASEMSAVGVDDTSVSAWLADTRGYTSHDPSDDMGVAEMLACKDVPRSLAECPAVARWLLAWLAGECPGPGEYNGVAVTCSGGWLEPSLVVGVARSCPRCNPGNVSPHKGTAIGRHLPDIYAHLDAAWTRETVECGECNGGRALLYREGDGAHAINATGEVIVA